MAKQKKEMRTKEPSLREKIKAFRRDLHGEVAAKFDEVFIGAAGGGKSLKECLQDGRDLQKAFVLAKQESEKLLKQVRSDLADTAKSLIDSRKKQRNVEDMPKIRNDWDEDD